MNAITNNHITRPTAAIAVCASCGFLVALLQTMMVPLVPHMPTLLAVTPSTATWLLTSTLVAGAVSAPVLGRLGDMYGKRRMLFVLMGVMLASCLLAAASPNFTVLVIARTLQGATIAVIALGMSLMRDVLPASKVAGGIALMSSSLGVGGAAGPPLAGLIAEYGSWRLLFVAVSVGTLVMLVLVPMFVPESPSHASGRFDFVGSAGLAVALVCLLLGISKGPAWGWSSPTVIVLLAVSLGVLAIWGRYELRQPSPVVDLRATAQPVVLWTNTATVLLGFSIFAILAMATQILQAPTGTGYGFGVSMLVAGVMLLPIGGSMMIFSSVSARITRSRGPRTTIVIGAILLTMGNAGLATLPHAAWLVVTAATVGAIGGALAYSALPLLIMTAVPTSETATATSINTLMRQLGTSTITAVAAAVGTALVIHVDGHEVPARAAWTVTFLAAAGSALCASIIVSLTPRPAGLSVRPDRKTASIIAAGTTAESAPRGNDRATPVDSTDQPLTVRSRDGGAACNRG